MEKHLALASVIKSVKAGARALAGRKRARVAAGTVALALLALYSTSFAAAGTLKSILSLGPIESAIAAAPRMFRPVLARMSLAAPQAQSNALNVGRRGHTATRLPDGSVLIVGGEGAGGTLNSSEIFDPASRTFSPGANAAEARTEHAAVRMSDGRVLITGGRNQSGGLDSTEIYDPSGGTFTAGPSLSRPRAGHSATLLADGRVLVVGGDEEGTAEVFDAQAQSVTPFVETLYTPRLGHSALLLKNGKVLVVGGNGPLGNPVQSGELFDPADESFSALPGALRVPRTRPVVRELPGGLVQVIGGGDSSMEIYVPANDDFEAYAHLPATTPLADVLNARTRAAIFRNGQTDALLDRAEHTVTEIPQSNLALVAGGVDGGGQILNTVSVVNSSAATVTTDKIDYGPGELVTITGTGFQPNEAVSIVLHEEEAAHADQTFTAVADAQGNFTNTDFTPEAHHFGVTFLLTAKGQSSAVVAQTTFTDAATVTTRVTLGLVFRLYGQSTPPIRVTFCEPITDGTGTCRGINGRTIEFTVGGEAVGSVVTSRQDINGIPTDGIAVMPYNVVKRFGAYTVLARFAGDDLYKTSVGTSTLNIAKAQTSITWPASAPIPYGTALDETHLNASIKDITVNSQFTGQAVQGTFNYTVTPGAVPAMGLVPNAGQNNLRADFVPADPVNYGPGSRFKSISVTKAPLAVTPDNVIRLYGEPNPELTGAVTGLVNNDPITAVFSTAATQSSGVGTYPITYTLSDPAGRLKNYALPATPATGTLSINRAPLTLKADDKSRPYGTDNPPLTFGYSGFVLGETAATPGVLSGAPSLTTTATPASAGGVYPITISAGTLSAPNYEFSFVDGSLTVTKAQSVLTLSGLAQTFDGTPKPVTVTTEPAGLQVVSVTYDGSAQAPTNAGTYAVAASLDNPNYESATATGTLVIGKADQSINFEPVANHTYGDAPFALSATSSAGLPVSFEVVSGNATVAGNVLTVNGTGPVTVRATQPGDANRNPATPANQTFEVAKAAAAISIDPASLSQTYSGAARTVNVTTTPAGLTGVSVAYSQNGVAVAAPTNAGTYAVTASLDNPNYQAAPAAATLVIGQADVQVNLESATYTFDGLPHGVNATVVGSQGQDIGTLAYTYTPRGDVGPDAFEPALPNPPSGQPASVPPAPAYATLNDPPAAPHLITVFPERDFVSAENYTQADGPVTVNVLRRSATGALVTVGSATVTPKDDPATTNFDGIVEVNHPGGACWVGTTPDIRPGDVVRVTTASGVADQTTVAYVSAGRPVQVNATTVRISGRAMDAQGNPLPLDQIEQRLITSSADAFVLSARRDVRAPGNGTLVYDDVEDPTHWTATYTNLGASDVERALRSESRVLWLGRNPVTDNELTIFEVGDEVFAGPQAPCSAPLEGSAPVTVGPVPSAPAYATLNDPPAAPHLITVFPERDFVSVENYSAADGPVTINVLRRVTQPGGTNTWRTVGSSTVALQDDPTTPNFDGIAEVNHPGGGCWVGTTPDIRPGDVVRVTTASGVADQTTVANVTAERAVITAADTVVIHGTAQDAAGNPLPLDRIEQRLISSSADRFNRTGRRDMRAGGGDVQDGTFAYDAPGSIHWTATYTNLGASDVERALRSESRVLWLGRNTVADTELTIFEVGDEVVGGPQAPCSAPLEGSSQPVFVGVYDVSVSLSGNSNYRVTANTAQITIVKANPAVSVTGGPFNYDGQPHAATVVVTGVGGGQFVPPDANTTVTYGTAATTNPPVASGTHSVTAAFAGSRNYNPANTTGSIVINNSAPVVADKQVATDEDQSVEIFLSATDPEGNGTTITVVGTPAHGRLGPMGEVICAANEAGGNDFCGVSVTYTPDANYSGPDSLTFKASDGANDSNVATVSITVNPLNDAPQVDAGLGGSVLEGGAFTGTGSFTDPDGGDAWTATINYGDGTGVQPLTLNPDKTFSLSHVYKDSGAYTVTVTVTDRAGASASDTATATSGNVAPTAAIVAPATSPEGTVIDLGSTATDPSEADTAAGFRYLWIIKKNGNPLAQSSLGVGTVGMTNFPFTPDDNGSYEVTLKVTDKDNGATTVVKTITVTNVAPKPVITGVPYSSPEATQINLGSTVKDPSGPDTTAGFKYLWVVKKNGAPFSQSALGDGTLGMTSYSFTPDEEGSYTVTLKVTDKDAGSTSVSRTINVTNVEPSDDFNDNTTDAGRWSTASTAGMTVAEQGAQLRVTTPGGSAVGYDGYYARTTFNLTNARATVELAQAPIGYDTETYFTLVDKATGGSTDMVFAVGGSNSLLMRERFNGTITSQATVTYDPAQHRFLRFRHDQAADTVNWETSPDGQQWTARHTSARRLNLTKMQGQIYAGRYSTTTPSATAVFDNYRIEPVPASPVLLSDNFNDNSADALKWTTVLADGMTVLEQNQRLEVTTPGTGTGYGGYYSAANYNLTGAQATVETVQAASGYGTDTYFVLHDKTTERNSFFMAVGGNPGSLLLQETYNSVAGARATIPYDPVQHRFWRIRHDSFNGTVNWETSPDRLQWTVQLTTPQRFDISNLQARIYAGRYTTSTPASLAVFDNFVFERLRAVLTPSDNFNDNTLDTMRWAVLNQSAYITVREQNQRVELALPANTASFNGIWSQPQTNLWNKTLSVEIPQATSTGGAGMETYYSVQRNGSNYFQVLITGTNTVSLDAVVNDVADRTQLNYDPAAHRFWRFRHHSATNTLHFESSADGVTWTTLKTANVYFPLDNVRVFMSAGSADASNPAPGSVVFDNLRLEANE